MVFHNFLFLVVLSSLLFVIPDGLSPCFICSATQLTLPRTLVFAILLIFYLLSVQSKLSFSVISSWCVPKIRPVSCWWFSRDSVLTQFSLKPPGLICVLSKTLSSSFYINTFPLPPVFFALTVILSNIPAIKQGGFYIAVQRTLFFVSFDNFLSHRMLLSFWKASLAVPFRCLISVSHFQSSVKILPRYLNFLICFISSSQFLAHILVFLFYGQPCIYHLAVDGQSFSRFAQLQYPVAFIDLFWLCQ